MPFFLKQTIAPVTSVASGKCITAYTAKNYTDSQPESGDPYLSMGVHLSKGRLGVCLTCKLPIGSDLHAYFTHTPLAFTLKALIPFPRGKNVQSFKHFSVSSKCCIKPIPIPLPVCFAAGM